MRRLLWVLPVAAAVGVAGFGGRAAARPDDDFGVLRTAPALPQGLPAGVEPDRLPTAGGPVGGPPVAPPNPFPLPAETNPWMICAATYIGPDGAELARQVTLELRNKHRLTAYIYNPADEERRKQRAEWEERKKKQPGVPLRFRGYRVTDQYAVLIDGFKDSPSATAYLPRVKALPMPELKLDSGMPAYDTAQVQEIDPVTKQLITRRANVNPFHSAMAVRNPYLASMQANKPRFDPFWKQLNAGESYSLLDNPKKYSLLVKDYSGMRVFHSESSMSSFLGALGLGGKNGDTLDAAGAQARELVRFLRTPQIGLESWVLHTRQASTVFVGGFDGPDDPNVARVLRHLSSLRFNTQGGVDPIGLKPNPPLTEIPRP